MTGLVIKLKPNEKILVNGIILQNCDRSARIRVRSDNVSILRSRDAISQEEATTPLRRIYYIAQLALAGEVNPEKARAQIQTGISQLDDIFSGTAAELLARASNGADDLKFFVVMRAIKKLFPLEQGLLSQTAPAS